MSLCFNKSNHEAKLISAWHNRLTVREKRSEKTGVSKTAGSTEERKVEQKEARQCVKLPVNAWHNPHLCFIIGNVNGLSFSC